jgi:hypothetical protein
MSILVKALSIVKLADDLSKGDQEWHHPNDVRGTESKVTANKHAAKQAMSTFKRNWNKK